MSLRVLVTGSSGFVGQNLVPYLKHNHVEVITLDKDPSPELLDQTHVTYRLGSFSGDLSKLMDGVDSIIHLASESHVDRSISGPRAFIDNNVNGTLELFEACKGKDLKSIILFSTDEVGACLEKGEMIEEYKFSTGSVYSATKAAQELLAQAYIKTFDLPIITTRCVNIFGAHQADEKLIPTLCKNAILGKDIPIYGDGMQLRQWVPVGHVCKFLNALVTSTYIPPKTLLHITGTHEVYNLMLARTILSRLERPMSLIRHVEDRLGHDTRYALGRTDATDRWDLPVYDQTNFIKDLDQTVDFYRGKYGK